MTIKEDFDAWPLWITAALVIVKLIGIFDLSWWWVFAPLWVTALIIIAVWLPVVLFWMCAAIGCAFVIMAYMLVNMVKRVFWFIGEDNV